MKYSNPVLSGMYPDPSVCYVDGNYYLVNSTFEYMPAVPVFRSSDLVNWEQIANCIENPESIGMLECPCSGGIFAPTIRWHDDKFYMITSCFGKNGIKNFYITAERAEGPWSEPIFIDIDGIDPSLYWENDKTYIQYAAFGIINQVEYDEKSGKIVNGPHVLTRGCGGRDTEGPHMWKRNGFYYLLLAEGGTREGHMVTIMRSRSVWGPFEASPYLPVVSNRDYAREALQCVGHADWVTDKCGNDYLLTLGCRYIKHRTVLGRETLLTPAYWTEDGWLKAATDNMPVTSETAFEGVQKNKESFFINMNEKNIPLNIISPRKRHDERVLFYNEQMEVTGNSHTLGDEADPVFLAVRQSEYKFDFESEISFIPEDDSQAAGVTVYADTQHYFSLFLSRRRDGICLIFRKKVDDLQEETIVLDNISEHSLKLFITGDEEKYYFSYSIKNQKRNEIGWTYNKHLSNSCTGSQNTGTVIGVYVEGECKANIKTFKYEI